MGNEYSKSKEVKTARNYGERHAKTEAPLEGLREAALMRIIGQSLYRELKGTLAEGRSEDRYIPITIDIKGESLSNIDIKGLAKDIESYCKGFAIEKTNTRPPYIEGYLCPASAITDVAKMLEYHDIERIWRGHTSPGSGIAL